jgi:hypothetical protein
MNEAKLQSMSAMLALSRVKQSASGADFARDFLLMWERMSGSDQQRSQAVRASARSRGSVVQLSKDMHAVREAGFKLAEQLLAEARKDLTKK